MWTLADVPPARSLPATCFRVLRACIARVCSSRIFPITVPRWETWTSVSSLTTSRRAFSSREISPSLTVAAAVSTEASTWPTIHFTSSLTPITPMCPSSSPTWRRSPAMSRARCRERRSCSAISTPSTSRAISWPIPYAS